MSNNNEVVIPPSPGELANATLEAAETLQMTREQFEQAVAHAYNLGYSDRMNIDGWAALGQQRDDGLSATWASLGRVGPRPKELRRFQIVDSAWHFVTSGKPIILGVWGGTSSMIDLVGRVMQARERQKTSRIPVVAVPSAMTTVQELGVAP